MTEAQALRDALELFACLMEYPSSEFHRLLGQAEALAGESFPEAAGRLGSFRRSVEGMSLDRLEELYTATFDLQVVCYPYVGYHLFGESYKRSAFLARLNEHYQAHGFVVERELPDHVPAVLRFLAKGVDEELHRVLVGEGLVPALEKMTEAFSEDANPYGELVKAVLAALEEARAEEPSSPAKLKEESVESC